MSRGLHHCRALQLKEHNEQHIVAAKKFMMVKETIEQSRSGQATLQEVYFIHTVVNDLGTTCSLAD